MPTKAELELEIKKLREELNASKMYDPHAKMEEKWRVTINGLGYDFDGYEEALEFAKDHGVEKPKKVFGNTIDGDFVSEFFDVMEVKG